MKKISENKWFYFKWFTNFLLLISSISCYVYSFISIKGTNISALFFCLGMLFLIWFLFCMIVDPFFMRVEREQYNNRNVVREKEYELRARKLRLDSFLDKLS